MQHTGALVPEDTKPFQAPQVHVSQIASLSSASEHSTLHIHLVYLGLYAWATLTRPSNLFKAIMITITQLLTKKYAH